MADLPVPAAARRDWDELAAVAGEGRLPAGGRDHLPAPARRWLDRCAPPGAPAARSIELGSHGEIRLGRWRAFRARQVIVPGTGLVWAARVGRRPLAVTGFDRFTHGTGQMRWRLAGLVPVATASGPDTDRSAAGRLAAEAVLLPPAMLAPGIAWTAVDERRARATVGVGPWTHELTLAVDGAGRLAEVSLPRWGAPGDGPPHEAVFRVALEGEVDAGGVLVPGGFAASWDDDPAGSFMRCTVDAARAR